MRRAARWLVLWVLMLAATSATARETAIGQATDFAADARVVLSARIPILVLYSTPGCPYCEAIRRSHLRTLELARPAQVIVRQVDLQSDATLIDFDGTKKTHADFALANKIKFAPTVVLYDAKGRALAPALVGAMLPDFYGQYLDDAIKSATAPLAPTKK